MNLYFTLWAGHYKDPQLKMHMSERAARRMMDGHTMEKHDTIQLYRFNYAKLELKRIEERYEE